MIYKKLFFFLFFIFSFFIWSNSSANELITIEEKSLTNNEVLSFFNDEFRIKTQADTLKNPVELVAKKLKTPFDWPWNYNNLSPVYEFDFSPFLTDYNSHIPITVEISYSDHNEYYKQIYFLDSNTSSWRPLPSVDFPDEGFVRARLHFPFSRLAILYTDKVKTVGQASWYKFRGGLFAASPDFNRGSIIRVHNRANNKYVDVVINDYGPDRSIYPNRVIDLDMVAYEKIAPLGSGIIDVKLEPLHIVLDDNDFIFTAGSKIPEISAKSAIIFSEKNREILFAKEADRVAPLASLSKIMTAKVFLDTKTSLDKEIIYLREDELHNHLYVRPWESARVNLLNGDIIKARDLLYTTLIGSANNATETLIRVSDVNRDEFIARMNIYAESYGALNTSFVEPTGLSAENMSSPLDYAIIISEIFKDEKMAKIANTLNYSFTTVNTNRSFRINNTNQLLRSNNYNIFGSKTGFINASGFCLFSRVKVNDDYLIIVTFNSENRAKSFNDHERLINYSLNRFQNL